MAEDLNVRVKPTPINPIEIKGAIAFSAEHSRIWAEGSDEEVEMLGGEHSAKGWADETGEESREYTDQQIAIARSEITAQINSAVDNSVNVSKSYADGVVDNEAIARNNADETLQGNIDLEESARIAADGNLQTQIDALSAASDVTDIVGTYAELQAYDTTHLKDNDIIKVLSDSTHSDAPSYYRWDKETETFSYIGSESASYTKAEADSKFLTQTSAASTYATLTDLSGKQDSLVSGTNIKTINSNSILGSGNITIDSLPSQTGQSGKFLTTDGSTASWATVNNALPSQTGHSGEFLTTNGTSASWSSVDMSGQANTELSNLTATGQYNTIQYALANIQETDSSKVGYVYHIETSANVYAPAGGKWLVLVNQQVSTATAAVYQFGAYTNKKPGEIIDGGTLVATYVSPYEPIVSLLKVA